jgi:hypothetical protein
MEAKELIGKTAIRTRPVMTEKIISAGLFSGGDTVRQIPDFYYCTTPIRILNATDYHIVFLPCELIVAGPTELKPRILDLRFCDDNWIDYESLISETKELKEDFLKRQEACMDFHSSHPLQPIFDPKKNIAHEELVEEEEENVEV